MGESKRVTPEVCAARAEAAMAEAMKDRMRSAVDRLTHAVRFQMRDMTPDMMAVALGTTVGVFAASAGGAEGGAGHRDPRRRGGPGGHRAGRGGRVMRFYFSRAAQPHAFLTRFVVSGVIEGDSLSSAQASLDAAFRDGGVPETHRGFVFKDLDEVCDAVNGILVTTTMEAAS